MADSYTVHQVNAVPSVFCGSCVACDHSTATAARMESLVLVAYIC